MRRTRSLRGFTLIELVMAFLIFFIAVSFSLWAMADANDQASAAERARQLRLLADRCLGQVALFERHFDTSETSEMRFDDLDEESRRTYEGWTWSFEIEDRTVFGKQKDDRAPYLFETSADPKEGTSSATDGTSGTAGGTEKGETVVLRVVKVKVTAPVVDGEQPDTIELVTFLPQVPAKAAASGAKSGTGDGK